VRVRVCLHQALALSAAAASEALAAAERRSDEHGAALLAANSEIARLRLEAEQLAETVRRLRDEVGRLNRLLDDRADHIASELAQCSFARAVPIYIDDLLTSECESRRAQLRNVCFYFLHRKVSIVKLVYRYYITHTMYDTNRETFALSPNQLQSLVSDLGCSEECASKVGMITKQCVQRHPLPAAAQRKSAHERPAAAKASHDRAEITLPQVCVRACDACVRARARGRACVCVCTCCGGL
jgi:hypothetical protein